MPDEDPFEYFTTVPEFVTEIGPVSPVLTDELEGLAEVSENCDTANDGLTEDIANAVAFLMGPDATYITGADLVVDGGLTSTLMAYNPGWKR